MARRRNKTRSTISQKLVRAIYFTLILTVLITLGSYITLRYYLHSERFRKLVETQLAKKTQTLTSIKPLSWKGFSFETPSLHSESPRQRINMDQITGEVRIENAKQRYWNLHDLQVKQLIVEVDQTSPRSITEDIHLTKEKPPSFIQRFIPKKVQMQNMQIHDSSLSLKTTQQQYILNRAKWQISKESQQQLQYIISVENGDFSMGTAPYQKASLKKARLRAQEDRINIIESEWLYLAGSYVQLRGELSLQKKSHSLSGTLEKLPLEKIVSENWQRRLQGTANSEFQFIKEPETSSKLQGTIAIDNAVLTALPVLDRLADYTERLEFRRLAFDTAKCRFSKEASTVNITDIDLVRNGLLKIQGNLTINGQNIEGLLQVGITPGTLSQIPGAEKKVFTSRKEGMLWTPVIISGTLSKPRENLKKRLYAAAGTRMLELLPEKSIEALSSAEELLEKAPELTEDLGNEIINQGEKIVEEGTRLFFDIFREKDEE